MSWAAAASVVLQMEPDATMTEHKPELGDENVRSTPAGSWARRTIAHILPFPSVGGTEHATLRIMKTLDVSRYRNVAFVGSESRSVLAFFADAGIPCLTYAPPEHSYRHALTYWKASLALARAFRRNHVDVVHCADLLAAYHAALAAWLARRPVLCHVRNRFDVISRRDRSFLWPIDRFVFVSQNTSRYFGCDLRQSKRVVVYDGIHVRSNDAFVTTRADVCREFDIPENALIVGMIARVAPQKDHATLARAAVRILREDHRAHFLIVGDNASAECHDHYVQIRRFIEASGVASSFTFTGYRTDVPRLLDAFDIFVLSTHSEGLPLVILEAMAAGKPVVATAVDGIPEIVGDGQSGLLFPPEDDDQLAAHIMRLLRCRSLARQLGDAGRALVQARFTWEQFAANMNALYAEFVEH
jgi:glycosyltransferase involved in cell wall biosynthesis